MIAKVAFYFFIFFFVVDGKAINKDESKNICEDSQMFCQFLPSTYCDLYPFLKKSCPFTCGQCNDPCSLNNGGCSQFCSGEMEPQCSCREGFELGSDGRTCIDINECSAKNNPCSEVEKSCVNSVGSYSCQFLKCENLEFGFRNYYRSDSCCEVEARKLPSENDLSKDEAEFELLLNESPSSSQWPWMAQILTEKFEGSQQYDHLCGGVIISKNWIATSSLCMKDIPLKSLKIVLGHVHNAQLTNSPKEKREERSVSKIIVHPDSTNNDVALLQLADGVHFNERIQAVHLPCGESTQEGTTCYVTGFGSKDNTVESPVTKFLKEISVKVVPSKLCEVEYSSKFNHKTMLCGESNKNSKPGFGDEGSPMVCQRFGSCQWYLSGLVSLGKGKEIPGVYTDIVHLEKWIRTEIGSDLIGSCN